jgi:hypothetical protein
VHTKKIAVAHFRFFEAEVRNKFGSTGKLLSSALHLQKNVTLPSQLKNFYHRCPSGWSGSRALRPQSKAAKGSVTVFCFDGQRWHVRTRETSGTERWPTQFTACTNFISKPVRVGCVGRAAILHNVLMQPAAEKL